MSNELTYPELWLLELSTKYDAARMPFRWSPDTSSERQSGYNEQWNCPPHGLSGRELCELLWKLFDLGDIEFQSISGEPDRIETVFAPADANDIYETMAFEVSEYVRTRRTREYLASPYHSYRVASAGIARWENYAVPNWDRYHGECIGRLYESGDTVWSQSATTEEFAREVVEITASDPMEPVTLHWDTAVVTGHEPWTPFPGKILARGVTLTLKATEHGQRYSGDEDVVVFGGRKQFNTLRQKYHDRLRAICDWYKNDTHNHPDRPARLVPQRDVRPPSGTY